MKPKIIQYLLILSLILNFYLIGKWLLIDQWQTPNEEEQVMLSELILKTVNSQDYKDLTSKHTILSIEPSMNRNNGGVFPYYFEIVVNTAEEESYYFSCTNDTCDDMSIYSQGFSRYVDEKQRFPIIK